MPSPQGQNAYLFQCARNKAARRWMAVCCKERKCRPMEDDPERKASLVYHYTAAEGLKGIIENRCIWATNVNFLNDFSEYQYGVEVVREGIKKLDFEDEDLGRSEEHTSE